MKFCYIGINYKNANLNIRDKISFTDQKKMDFLAKAEQSGVNQCMILSTCNRSEVFYFAQEQESLRNLYLSSFAEPKLEQYLQQLEGQEAMAYLFRITAGLESLVLGEDQILGQVKDAYDFSKAMGYAQKELSKIVREAVTCAKKIKTELKISENPLSVSYIGIQQVEQEYGIEGKQALVIGSGKTAVLALRYLYYYKADKVIVCSRSLSHAKALREEFEELKVVDYENRYNVIADCDIIISATSSPHTVVKADALCRVCDNLEGKVFLDLAAPRDIDPGIRDEQGVLLIDLDSLEQIARENKQERIRLMEISRTWIDEAVEQTQRWMLSAGVDDTILSLQQRCEEIVDDTYEYLERKLTLEAREKKILKKMLHASLRRLIREPILALKQLDSEEKQQEYQKVVRTLFHITQDESSE